MDRAADFVHWSRSRVNDFTNDRLAAHSVTPDPVTLSSITVTGGDGERTVTVAESEIHRASSD